MSVSWRVIGYLPAEQDARETGRALLACDLCGSLALAGAGQGLHEDWHEHE